MSRQIKLNFIALFVLTIFYTTAWGLQCRQGVENIFGSAYNKTVCSVNETACFQSAKCETKNAIRPHTDYKWRCIDQKICRNTTDGNSYATYEGVKGICCYTDLCNDNKISKCTASDSGNNLRVSIITICSTLALTFLLS